MIMWVSSPCERQSRNGEVTFVRDRRTDLFFSVIKQDGLVYVANDDFQITAYHNTVKLEMLSLDGVHWIDDPYFSWSLVSETSAYQDPLSGDVVDLSCVFRLLHFLS
jgi:hypothetical protein